MSISVARELRLPGLARTRSAGAEAGREMLAYALWHDKAPVGIKAEKNLSQFEFIEPERPSVGLRCVLFVGGAIADVAMDDDERRFIRRRKEGAVAPLE